MKTRKTWRMVIGWVVMLGWAGFAGAQTSTAASTAAPVETRGRLWLEGKSTLHPYHADAKVFRATVQLAPDATPGWEPLLRSGKLKQLTLEVPVGQLTSGEDGLDQNMRKALEMDAHPLITLVVRHFEAGEAAQPGGPLTLKMKGALTVAGTERPVELQAEVVPAATELHLTGNTQLLMTDYGVTPPVLMLGMLKTDNHVTIRFDLWVKQG